VTAPAPWQAEPGVEVSTLDNGLVVLTEAMPEARSVTIGAWVRVGGRDEPDELSGASHFLEHLLFKGTATRTARQIAEVVDGVGGDMNAVTSREHTAYYARLPHQHLGLGLEVLGDVLTTPALRAHDIEAERQVILEEILMNLDAPEDRVHTLLAEALFPDHPLGRDVLGDRWSVEAISGPELRAFFEHWYRPATTVLVAAGNLVHDDVVARAAAALGSRVGGEVPVRSAPAQPPVPLVAVTDDTEQVHLCLGWRGVDLYDEDRYALTVANQVLGGGTASRLFQEVREERGLAYSVYSYLSTYVDAGALTVYCGTAPTRAGETLRVIDGVIADLVEHGPTEAELAVAAGYLEGSLVLGLEDSASRMGRLGRSMATRGEVTPLEVHLDRIRAVTVDDAHRVLARVLRGPRTLAAVGPVDGDRLTA
jgi:predicted Zn-dependent peptidase